jgi:hypothetical protein
MRPDPKHEAVTYGIDIGKMVFHAVALDAEGFPVHRAKFARPVAEPSRRPDASL